MASTFRQYWDLTKPRVVALIVFTALVGMCLAIDGLPDFEQLLRGALGFIGIWLAASSAAAINQLLDASRQFHDVCLQLLSFLCRSLISLAFQLGEELQRVFNRAGMLLDRIQVHVHTLRLNRLMTWSGVL